MAPAEREHEEDTHVPRVRRYRTRGIDVEIRESRDRVELTLDGQPIKVAYLDGQYSSHTANMFRTFDSVEEIVDELLANEGRTWTLHGSLAHDHEEDEPDHDHDHGPGGHPHEHEGHRGGSP